MMLKYNYDVLIEGKNTDKDYSLAQLTFDFLNFEDFDAEEAIS